MAILASEITFQLSGGAANSNPALSIGGGMSTVVAANPYFDDISSAEAAAGMYDYRLLYVKNSNATLTYQTVKLWIQSEAVGPTSNISIGVAVAAAGATEATPTNENTAPASVIFSDLPISFATGLSLGNIPNNSFKGFWVRRYTPAGSTSFAASFQLNIQGDTAA